MELDESRGAFLADRYQRANTQSAAELLGCSGLQWIVILSHQFYPTGLYRLDDGRCDSVPFGSTKFEGKFMVKLLLLNLLMSSQQEGHTVT